MGGGMGVWGVCVCVGGENLSATAPESAFFLQRSDGRGRAGSVKVRFI